MVVENGRFGKCRAASHEHGLAGYPRWIFQQATLGIDILFEVRWSRPLVDHERDRSNRCKSRLLLAIEYAQFVDAMESCGQAGVVSAHLPP